MVPSDDIPLGKISNYPTSYNADLLVPINRQDHRQKLGIGQSLPFNGVDLWNAWELSWLNPKGLPNVATGVIQIPCTSDNIIESKSLKLYLNSLNQTRFATEHEFISILRQDLSKVSGAPAKVTIRKVLSEHENISKINGSAWSAAKTLDNLDVSCEIYSADPSLLQLQHGAGRVTECLCSHLLKTNCPVTGQPDWATVFIHYTGSKINHESLLRFIVSLRQHQDFHENCVEMIFMEIAKNCQPQKLAVYARYTRRGGLDINPMRSNFPISADNIILTRQ